MSDVEAFFARGKKLEELNLEGGMFLEERKRKEIGGDIGKSADQMVEDLNKRKKMMMMMRMGG